MGSKIMCNFCKSKIQIHEKKYLSNDSYLVECFKCGTYEVTGTLDATLASTEDVPFTASCWIKEQNLNGIFPRLNSDDYTMLMSIPDKRLSQKYERFIQYLCDEGKDTYCLNNVEVYTRCWINGYDELNRFKQKAIQNGHLILKYSDDKMYLLDLEVTYNAHEYLENLGYKTNSNKIFMAFMFNDDMFKQFQPTIERAVHDASDGNIEAVRVSSSTTSHDVKIDDELISMLKSSKAVIADFTGDRSAVYYEAGYAMGMGIPVIWTCKASDIDKLSFDTRQYPHIVWNDEQDLYGQVYNRLKAKVL